ncbi:MAG: DUF6036 family nucleotidyltransferase [Myxococcota bacterium]
MSALAETLRSVAGVLDAWVNEGRCEGWYVFGAQAVSLRGAPRTTQDLDITVALRADLATELLAALEAAGLRHRHPSAVESLLVRASILPMVHPSGMELDVVMAGSGLERLALERSETLVVEGVEVPVALATDLVIMKILAGRGKDMDDVRALLAGGEVDVGEVRSLLAQLDAALERSDLREAFERLLLPE